MYQRTIQSFSRNATKKVANSHTANAARKKATAAVVSSTSTANPGPYGDNSSTVHTSRANNNSLKNCASAGFSTAVAYGPGSSISSLDMRKFLENTQSFAQMKNVSVLGRELSMKEAVAAVNCEDQIFDKILLLQTHGESARVTAEDARRNFANGKVEGDLALTPKGIGGALKMLTKTGEYCSNVTHLIPELFIISPHRCAAETALLSFPYYAPGSLYESKWVCHGSFHDGESEHTSCIDTMKHTFPSIDFSTASDSGDFLSWLNRRKEKVIVITSTPSWIEKFCDTIEPGSKVQDLRAVGIKFTQL